MTSTIGDRGEGHSGWRLANRMDVENSLDGVKTIIWREMRPGAGTANIRWPPVHLRVIAELHALSESVIGNRRLTL